MPAWWGRKTSSKKKEKHHHHHQQPPIKDRDGKGKEKHHSFDETSSVLPKNKDSASGFDSDGVLEKRGHPLPRPSSVVTALPLGHDPGSVSSLSSSGSFEEPSDLVFSGLSRYSDPMNTPRGRSSKPDWQRLQQIAENKNLISNSSFIEHPRLPDIPGSPRSEILDSPTPSGSAFCSPRASIDIEFNPRSRSPGPGTRGHTLPTSPLHSRVSGGFSPGSSIDKQDDGKPQCHPLPLPPGSPNSPTLRRNVVNENGHFLRSRWKKGKLLGRGTFGHVFVGFNSENGQMCAIKEVRVISDDQNSKESLRQLNQEISLLSQLSHPNIVRYYGSELVEDTLSVYLEYVSGGSIHKLLQEYGPFKEPVVQSYTAQILSGLAYLHERNTVHRDIKGANILVDPNGEIKLADFGMAKHITSCSSVLSFKGSPYWMAPEVIMNCNGYNLSVDIWSLGCTILEMATSKPPWSQYEGVAAIFKIGNSKDIPEIPDHISDTGKSFLKLCLQRDPSARPTAAQLLEHPFVRDQATAKVTRIDISKDSLQYSADDNHAMNMNRKNIISHDADYGMRRTVGFPTAFSSNQVGMRMNLSLPVSPCSSPLRNFGPAHRSCFLSPPPAYMMGTGNGPGLINHSVSPRSVNAATNDAWPDIPQLRIQTPQASPRARQMHSLCL